MILWTRAWRLDWLFGLGCVCGAICAALAGEHLRVPSLAAAGFTDAPIGALISVPPCALLVHAWANAPWDVLKSSARRVDITIALSAAMGPLGMVSAAVILGLGTEGVVELLRNGSVLIAITCIAWSLGGTGAASLAAPLAVCVTVLLGRGTGGSESTHWWAVLLQPSTSGSAAIITVALVCAAIVVVHREVSHG